MLQNTCKKYELNLNLTSSYKRQRNGSALSLHKLRVFGYAFQGRVTVLSTTCASNFIYKKSYYSNHEYAQVFVNQDVGKEA